MGIHSFHASVFDTLEFDIQRKRQKQSEDELRAAFGYRHLHPNGLRLLICTPPR
ncbi:MAG: hypothetical protein VB053_03525 [Oscillibacter ruminantium]|uniref:hypothetical protein n=1 Tax=Oscillibacter ruminantium TaxID=1263547 RepID=UPI002B209DC5|nr:hypothetical protein [Oscillibacter ruminantium]MEA5041595.1 hypothetical protein [Oscillibacter ruminantium]